MRRAAITGATGFIGRVIAGELRAAGWQVQALARSAAGQARLQDDGLTVIAGDLADTAALLRLVENADAVVHCAGAVRGARYADFEAVNVTGTHNLLRALQGRDVPVLLLSSLAAREARLSHYARSKQAMEALLQSVDAPPRWLVLRPPPVYGPGDKELMPLFQAMARGIAPLPGAADARVSMLYVEDLARAALTWLDDPGTVRGVFELHDGQPGGYSWDEIVGIAATLLGRRVRKLRLPAAPLNAFARANAALARVTGHAPMLTPGKLGELRHPDWVADNAKLSAAINWLPRVALREGLQLTCGWGKAA